MTEEAPRLTRKPFGYDTALVDKLLDDQRSMLASAERRVRDAEAATARLEERLAARDALVDELRVRLDALASGADQSIAEDEPPEQPHLSPEFMTQELAKVISAAEESTNLILERTRVSTQEQILQADRLWNEVQESAVRFAQWRESAVEVVGGLKSAIDEARQRIERIPQSIQEALAPAVEVMIRVDGGLGRFSEASELPLLGRPSGLLEATAMVPSPMLEEMDMATVDVGPEDEGSLEGESTSPEETPDSGEPPFEHQTAVADELAPTEAFEPADREMPIELGETSWWVVPDSEWQTVDPRGPQNGEEGHPSPEYESGGQEAIAEDERGDASEDIEEPMVFFWDGRPETG